MAMRSLTPARVRPPWRSKVRMSLGGPKDRLDPLSDRGQAQTGTGLVAAHGPHDPGPQPAHAGGELATRVALVADERQRIRAAHAPHQLQAHLALIARGMSQGEGARGAVGGEDRMQAKSPEPARVRGAVAVAGRIRQRRALDRLAASGAFDRGGVDKGQIIDETRAHAGKHARQPLDRLGQPAAALVVARLAGKAREQCDRRRAATFKKRRSDGIPITAWATAKATTSASVTRRLAFATHSGRRSSAVQ